MLHSTHSTLYPIHVIIVRVGTWSALLHLECLYTQLKSNFGCRAYIKNVTITDLRTRHCTDLDE